MRAWIERLKEHLLSGGKVVFIPGRRQGKSVFFGQVCAGCFKPFPKPHGCPEYCSECDEMGVKKILGNDK